MSHTFSHESLEISHLSLAVPIGGQYVEAVSDVSLLLNAGRVMGLVGESGCGKSLTAQALLRLGEHQGVKHCAGDVLLGGKSIFAMSESQLRHFRGGQVAMIFQEPMTALNPVFTVGAQITEVIRLHLDVNKQTAKKRAIALLHDVGMAEASVLMGQYPDALSGGMRQRILIAMAMATNPRFIVADEPTTALDVSVQKRIIALLRRLQQQHQQGMLLVTHDFGLVAEMCDDVAVMYAGQIVERATVHEIFNHARHPYTRALMDCRPEIGVRGDMLPVIAGQVPAPGQYGAGCRFAKRCAFADDQCASPIAENAWHDGTHHARCVHGDQQ
ncbi:MAG: ABC transporter ATP-binding protein [Mariprofundaceae bacterium]|nr:ABC transporter ATP-binding protein [Mariprofundaceae bacterium]